jgi:hypothetical protein
MVAEMLHSAVMLLNGKAGREDTTLAGFILRYEEVRTNASPEDAVMGILESAYVAGKDAAQWDRAALERAVATARCG